MKNTVIFGYCAICVNEQRQLTQHCSSRFVLSSSNRSIFQRTCCCWTQWLCKTKTLYSWTGLKVENSVLNNSSSSLSEDKVHLWLWGKSWRNKLKTTTNLRPPLHGRVTSVRNATWADSNALYYLSWCSCSYTRNSNAGERPSGWPATLPRYWETWLMYVPLLDTASWRWLLETAFL